MTDLETRLEDRLRSVLPADADYASARHVVERGSHLLVRNGVVEPASASHDEGVMFTVWRNGGIGYGATSDLTDAGLAAAIERASEWAAATAGRTRVSISSMICSTTSRSSPS